MPANVKLPEVTVPEPIKTVLANNLELLPEMSEAEVEYVKMLKKLAKTRVLPAKGHLEICKILLYVEQYYIEEDLKSRRMMKQKPTQDPRNKMFTVIVPNLDEDDPFINVGDMVLLDQNILRIIEIHNGSLKARAEGYYDFLFISLSLIKIDYFIISYFLKLSLFICQNHFSYSLFDFMIQFISILKSLKI